MFKSPESNRIKSGPMATSQNDGNNGVFIIDFSSRTKAVCIISDGLDWEHVSVHMVSDKKDRTPTWSEMCKVKDLFWDDSDCVMQYHPPKSEYVNIHNHTLHLWRPINQEFPSPPKLMV